MKQVEQIQTFTQEEEGNVIFTSNLPVLPDTLIVTVNDVQIPASMIGASFIKLQEAPPVQATVIVKYKTEVEETEEDPNINSQFNKLAKRIEFLEEQNLFLARALQERVSNTTFRRWIEAMEKSYGQPVLNNNSLLDISSSKEL